MTISLKRRLTFDELVQENRHKILNDQSVLERIEKNIDNKKYQSLNNAKEKLD